jgi:hypothetical protein
MRATRPERVKPPCTYRRTSPLLGDASALFLDVKGTFVASLNRSVEPGDAGRLAASPNS